MRPWMSSAGPHPCGFPARVLEPEVPGGRVALPGRTDLLVGGRHGALEQGREALHECVQQFARGAVERIAAPPGAGASGEHRAVPEPPPYARQLLPVRLLDHTGQPYGRGVLRGDGPGELGHPYVERVDDPGRRASHGLLTGRRVVRPVGEPGAQGRDGGGGQQPAAAARGLGQLRDGEAGHVAEAVLG